MEASATAKANVDPRVVITCNLALNELSKLCTCCIYGCISIPINILKLCWKTQIFIVCFPVKCAFRTLHFAKSVIVRVLYGRKTNKKKLLEAFMHCNLGEKEKVLQTMKDFRTGSLIAVAKMDILNRELDKCRREITRWKVEADRHTRLMSSVASEERKLLKVIVSAIKRLRTLKSSKEDMDMTLKDTVNDICQWSKNLFSKQFCDCCSVTPTAEGNSILTASYNKLSLETEMMRQVIEKRRSAMTTELPEDDIFLPNIDVETDSRNLLNLSVGTLDSILSFLDAENLQLRMRLKESSDQLDDVRNSSLARKAKVRHLEKQLTDAMTVLRRVESDRDSMRNKLLSLQQLIQEEEDFLNVEDSCSEISFHNQRDAN